VIEPAPLPQPPPPPLVRRKVSFSADELFDFGKDSVRPAGYRALDAFRSRIEGDSVRDHYGQWIFRRSGCRPASNAMNHV
jgi:hypothetical protein